MVTPLIEQGANILEEALRKTEGDREISFPYADYLQQTDKVYPCWPSGSFPHATPHDVLERPDIQRFRRLVDEWHRETEGLALASRICSHHSYLKIIGMGRPVIRLILNELAEKEPDHWFLALRILTDTNPVRVEDAGKMHAMAEAWVNWGKEQGYPII